MKKNYELYLFIALQICLTLIYIYKESRSIEVFYKNQRLEKKHAELVSQVKDTQNQLQTAKNRSLIQQYAHTNKLEPLSLSAVRHIDAHEPA